MTVEDPRGVRTRFTLRGFVVGIHLLSAPISAPASQTFTVVVSRGMVTSTRVLEEAQLSCLQKRFRV